MKKQVVSYKRFEETTELWFSLPHIDSDNPRPFMNVESLFLDVCFKNGASVYGIQRLESENSPKLLDCQNFLVQNPGTLYVTSVPSKNIIPFLKDMEEYISTFKVQNVS